MPAIVTDIQSQYRIVLNTSLTLIISTKMSQSCQSQLRRMESWNCCKTPSALRDMEVGSTHYIDVIMTTMASQITSLTVVYSTFYSDADQRKHQSSASLAFVWGIHRDRWIPRTKGQLRGRCFHLMTSSTLCVRNCFDDVNMNLPGLFTSFLDLTANVLEISTT